MGSRGKRVVIGLDFFSRDMGVVHTWLWIFENLVTNISKVGKTKKREMDIVFGI